MVRQHTQLSQSAEYGTFRRDLRCARRNFLCSLLSILNSLLKISGVQVPYSAHEHTSINQVENATNSSHFVVDLCNRHTNYFYADLIQ